MQEAKKEEGLKAIRPKMDRTIEAVEKALLFPWQGVRPDLVLHKGAPQSDEKESYILEDPVRGIHFELGEADAQLFLCLVMESDLKAAVERLIRTTTLRPNAEAILRFTRMLQIEKLANLPPEAALSESPKVPKMPKRKFSIMSILFFRIPVFRPDDFLNAVYPWFKPLWSAPFRYLYGVMGIMGLISVFQQIELYLHTASHLFTPKGALLFFACLYTLKIMHEFGHALAAKHHGIYVRRMGIYMMFFTPMLYTDTTDAWKIPTRKGRFIIGAAGVIVEFYVACISLFFWSVLPDGLLRSLMFYMSGASLISTVLANLNPFMRFDGYYLLMDYLRISNLRTRSIMMSRHFMRKILLDWKGPKPEEHPRYRFMAIFGLFVNLYLISIILSINISIYNNISKLLGIWGIVTGFAVFFGKGMWTESIVILKNRKYWGSKIRMGITALVILMLITVLFIPLPKKEQLPAMFLIRNVARLEALGRGKITTQMPEVGTIVNEGDLLIRIEDENLLWENEKLGYDLMQTEKAIETMPAGGASGGYRKWLIAERQRLKSAVEKVRQSLSQLEIRSPITGRVVDVNETLKQGSYVYKANYLLSVANSSSFEVRAYVREDVFLELRDMKIETGRVFFYDIKTPIILGKVREMLNFPVSEFPNDSLFDYAGGDILSQRVSSRQFKPKIAHYPLVFDIPGSPDYIVHGMRCIVEVERERSSVMGSIIKEAWRFMSSEGFV